MVPQLWPTVLIQLPLNPLEPLPLLLVVVFAAAGFGSR